MEREIIKFTAKDLACEAFFTLLSTLNPIRALIIIHTGIQYNNAKKSGDRKRIRDAFHKLDPELKLFKKNFLNRGKGHW